jgi:branched-chain amino acid transport system permease protein
MTTTTMPATATIAETWRRLRLGPYLFVVALAAVAFALIGPAQFVNALTVGAIYALIALGYTMVYGIIELINFAHGEVFMVGAFMAVFVLTGILGQDPSSSAQSAPQAVYLTLATFAIVMPFMGLVGVVIERFAYRPLRNAPRLAPLITAIGVSFILQNLIQIVYGPSPRNTPQVIPPTATIEIGPITLRVVVVFVIAVSVGLMIALQLFVNRTRLGRAMRSTAQDRDAAQLMGVNINRTIALTFFIGSALAGAAGIAYGYYYGNIVFNMGFKAGLYAFTAAVLGGIGNIAGAALGGFVIGFIETTATAYGFNQWGAALVFVVLITTLVFRPTGLLGQQLGERA